MLDSFADILKEMQRFWKKLSIILFFSFLVFPISVFCQVDTAWVRYYNGPADTTDQANAIAVDASGNVYITGFSYGIGSDADITTIKYDPQGNQLWLKRYNGTGNSFDKANVLILDDQGNVYVAGNSYGSGTTFDLIIAKYDSSGNELWVRRYNGAGNGHDGATSIALDKNKNLYVTGYSSANAANFGTDYEYVTIKYDSLGNQLWLRNYNPGYYMDIATSIAAAPDSSVYITGYTTTPGTIEKWVTIKYNTMGDEQWKREFIVLPGSWNNIPSSVKVDKHDNVYVTGAITDSLSGVNHATVKYDAQGNQLWASYFSGPGNYVDWPAALALDAEENVYITGYSTDIGTDADIATIKYDSLGNQVWVQRYNGLGNGRDVGQAIVIDSAGNIYVCGSALGDGTSTDYTTIRYDSLGNELWVMRYDGTEHFLDDAFAITIDAEGNVYVTGRSAGSQRYYDYATIKYSPLPALNGDLNLDGVLTMADVVLMLNFAFNGDPFPAAPTAADFNCDGAISPADIVLMLQIFFLAAPAPC